MAKSKKSNTCSSLINKKMNQDTYILRQEVMKLIYEAKQLVPSLPRITVRITHDHQSILGMGRIGGNQIWISERAISCNEFDLRAIVFHEILHAVFSLPHDNSCPLMKPVHSPLSKKEAQNHFIKWVNFVLQK